MSQKRVQQLLPELKRLSRMKDKERKKSIASGSRDFIQCICECVKNLIKGRIPMNACHMKLLARRKQSLRKLALKQTALSKRKEILQKGGFIGLLLKPLLSGLISLAG